MYKEIVQVKSIREIKEVLLKENEDYYFTENELKSVENKNRIKSLGARYLIKKSMLEFFNLGNEFQEIEISNSEEGKPMVLLKGKVKMFLDKEKVVSVNISISHSRNFVSTLVVIE